MTSTDAPELLTARQSVESTAPAAVRSLPATLAFFPVAFVLVFGAFTVGHKFNVDENVFIASGALLARKSILLYRDYHYNHMPTLVIIYAALFRATDHLLLAARTFSALCAAGAAAVLFHLTYRSLAFLSPRKRLVFSIGIGLTLLFNPLFVRTAGRAWNHDFPVLMSLLAFVTMARGLGGRSSAILLALGGLFAGLAFTARLTFVTMMLPFVMFVLLYPGLSVRRRVVLLGAFSLGCLIACAPSIWVWAQSVRNAYFGNFQYPALNTRFHREHDDAKHRGLALAPRRVFYFISLIWEMPGNGVVVVAFATLTALTLCRRGVLRDPFQCELLIVLLVVLSQVAAGLVPAPPFVQYFYAATPFMILGVALCLGARPNLGADDRLQKILIGCLVVCVVFSISEYRGIARLPFVKQWAPMITHAQGVEVVRQAGPGPILTLEPVFPLEGGADTYEALATGRFAMRVGDYLTPQQRAQYRMYGSPDLEPLYVNRPPHAVLATGTDDGVGIEEKMVAPAKARGYRSIDIPHVGTLWVAPN